MGVVWVFRRKNCPSVGPADVFCVLWLLLCCLAGVLCVCQLVCAGDSLRWGPGWQAEAGCAQELACRQVPLPVESIRQGPCCSAHTVCYCLCVRRTLCVGRMGRRACLCQLSVVRLLFLPQGLLSPAAPAAVQLLRAYAFVDSQHDCAVDCDDGCGGRLPAVLQRPLQLAC